MWLRSESKQSVWKQINSQLKSFPTALTRPESFRALETGNIYPIIWNVGYVGWNQILCSMGGYIAEHLLYQQHAVLVTHLDHLRVRKKSQMCVCLPVCIFLWRSLINVASHFYECKLTYVAKIIPWEEKNVLVRFWEDINLNAILFV